MMTKQAIESGGTSTDGASACWSVGALTRALADALSARFNPVTVRGEISGFSRAASGHCYFSLKDAQGQLRCAMFRRAADLLDALPADGDQVEVRGRVDIYPQRGDLQLVVETLRAAGQGVWLEKFLRLKARLAAEGLFDSGRKRPLSALPRGIGVVTSAGAAAWHDVMTALSRRAPHLPVWLAPASVQGLAAPAELVSALQALGALATRVDAPLPIDVILLVRGGGSIEDLWAFNDEALARAIIASPVPVISGVGHETDFTIADFVADLRAPTPTAAAELAARPRADWLQALQGLGARLVEASARHLDAQSQRLDRASARLGRPSGAVHVHQLRLQALRARLEGATRQELTNTARRWERADAALRLLDPSRVLQRGYAMVLDDAGAVVTRAGALRAGQTVELRWSDGAAGATVDGPLAAKKKPP